MSYATIVKRMSQTQKIHVEVEAEKFAEEIGHKFVYIEKAYKGGYCATFINENNEEIGASVVKCPHCDEIQVCYGEYGDPATEICICTKCHKNYECEPF